MHELERFQSSYGNASVFELARMTTREDGKGAERGRAKVQRAKPGQNVLSDANSSATRRVGAWPGVTPNASGESDSRQQGGGPAHPAHWMVPESMDAVHALLKTSPGHRGGRDVDILLPVLQRVRAIRTLPELAQRALCVVSTLVQLEQGRYLYRRGDPCDAVYVVLTGMLHLIIPGNPAGIWAEDIQMGVIRAGIGFGDVALLNSVARNADALAQDSDCTLLRLSMDDYTLITNALQTEELLKVCQMPSSERTDSSLKLVNRIVCDNVPHFSAYNEEQKMGFARAFKLERSDVAGHYVFQANSPAVAMYVSLSCTVDLHAKSSLRRKGGLLRTLSAEISKDGPNEENTGQEGHLAIEAKGILKGLMNRNGTVTEPQTTRGLAFIRRPSAESAASHSPVCRTTSNVDCLVAHVSCASTIAPAYPGDIFGVSEATGPSMSLHTNSARIVKPGYLLVLSRDDYQQIVNGYQDSDARARLMECIGRVFQVRGHQQRQADAGTPGVSSNLAGDAGSDREEILQRLGACFTLSTFRAGESLVLQSKRVEDVCIIQSGTCDVKVELQSIKKDHTESTFSRAQDRRGRRSQVKVAALGQNTLIGLADAFFNAEVGMATYEASTGMLVYKAEMRKVLSLLQSYPLIRATLSATFKSMLMTWADRLMQTLRMSAKGEQELAPWATQHVHSFLHPQDPHSACKLGALAPPTAAAAAVSIGDIQASRGKESTDPLREHPELLSEFKSKLLQDDMSVVARSARSVRWTCTRPRDMTCFVSLNRIAQVREKQATGRQLVPQLNTDTAVLTKHRMEALAASRHHKMHQTTRSKSPNERCMWGGLEMTQGAWLTDRVARNTTWLKPYLGVKYSEFASARKNPLEGKFAGKAADAVRRSKTPPHPWKNVARYHALFLSYCVCTSSASRMPKIPD